MSTRQKRPSLLALVALLLSLLTLSPWVSSERALAQGKWEELNIPGPSPRYGHSMVAMGSNAFLFAGLAETASQVPQNDLWAFNRGGTKLDSTQLHQYSLSPVLSHCQCLGWQDVYVWRCE